MQDPAGFLTVVTEQLAKLPCQLWRTNNEGFTQIAAVMTALRQLAQVEHALSPSKREEALASLTQMAQTGYDRNTLAKVGPSRPSHPQGM